MLSELRVSRLGVIDDLAIVFGPGLTALTGETGAGKTLVVEAIQLLLGSRAEGMRVRPESVEAVVEGRFVVPAQSAPPVRTTSISGRKPKSYWGGWSRPRGARAHTSTGKWRRRRRLPNSVSAWSTSTGNTSTNLFSRPRLSATPSTSSPGPTAAHEKPPAAGCANWTRR